MALAVCSNAVEAIRLPLSMRQGAFVEERFEHGKLRESQSGRMWGTHA
jgi:hypothetical protein